MTNSRELVDRIVDKDARIGMVGLGYVGLPISLAFIESGFEVYGYDIDSTRVSRLKNADSYIDDVSDDRLQAGLEAGFVPDDESENIEDCDVYIIAVPTDVRKGEPMMDAVRAASETVGKQAGTGNALVVVSSTVYPGATREVVEPILEAHRPKETTHLSMVPERLNPGGDYDATEIPLVVGADTEIARRASTELFEAIVVETHPVSSTTNAELTKTLENTYRMVNIALVNEMAKLSEQMGADIWEAIEAADTKPFGYQAFQPGPGVGGHCIPVDPQFLSWQGRNHDESLTLVEQAQQANESMPVHVLNRFEAAVAGRGVELEDATIAVFGVAYKSNIGDVRNSPARTICEQLEYQGTTLELIDPYVNSVSLNGTEYTPTDSPGEIELTEVDAALVLVNHDAFEYTVLEQVPLVFDAHDTVPQGISAAVVTLGEDWSASRKVSGPISAEDD